VEPAGAVDHQPCGGGDHPGLAVIANDLDCVLSLPSLAGR